MILGDGSDKAQLLTLASQLGVEPDVQLRGFEINPYKYMARAAIFVLSSIYEGLPNTLIEAQALGVPAVSTDCPSGPREILMDGAAGPLVPVGDFQMLAAQILRLLQDKALARRFAEEGLKGIGRFRPEQAIKQYLGLLDGRAD